VAIKVNVLRREAPKRASAGLSGVSMPKISIPGGRLMPLALIAGVIVIGGLLVYGVMVQREKAKEAALIKNLEATDRDLQLRLTELQVAERARNEIKRRLDIIGRVAKSQKVPVEVMNGLLRAVPQGIWLTVIDMKPQEIKVKVDANRPAISYSSDTLQKLAAKKDEAGAPKPGAPPAQTKEVTEITGFALVVKGKAFNNFQVADFMENLKKAGLFSDVDFTVTQADAVEAVRVMDFEVTASVKL
jgi:Tfp pilus assembly protein PilN